MISKLKKSIALIGLGFVNILHASMHLIQFIQSVLLINHSHHPHDDGVFDTISHNPYLSILWVIVGVFTLWVGIKDFIHHKKCNH
jgi:hypothetical protein